MKHTLLSLILCICGLVAHTQNPAGSPVAIHGLLKTKGNKIVGKADTAVAITGNSLFWSQWAGEFYNPQTVKWLKTDWHSKIIRAAMGVDENGGYIKNAAAEKKKITNVVDACITEGLYVIIDWHSHHAENYKTESIAFFKEMATKYGSYPNVIYELYNEPLDVTSWSQTIKPYAVDVISEIRKIDPDNLILVGTRTWSQEVVEAANDRINDVNVAYVLHFYVGSHSQYLRDKAQQAINMGLPVFVSEWGVWGSDADLENWMVFMRDNKLSWCNWAVVTKDEPSSVLKPGTTNLDKWSSSQLTGIGVKVRNYLQDWPRWSAVPVEPCLLTSEPYKALSLPGTIEAEFYDKGCEGGSYHDIDAANQGGKFRTDGVDIETCSDAGAGFNVGYFEKEEWLQYTVDVTESGFFNATFRVAAMAAGGSFKLQLNGVDITQNIAVPETGDWQKWTDVSVESLNLVRIDNAKLRLVVTAPGFNLNRFSVSSVVTGIGAVGQKYFHLYPAITMGNFKLQAKENIRNISVYHITGMKVLSEDNPGTEFIFGESFSPGSYIAVIQFSDGITIKRRMQKL